MENGTTVNKNAGKRQSMVIIANQAEDRITSKRNARRLTYVHGAPRTQYEAQSIATTWDAFYKGTRTDEDTTACPTGEQIFRYIDTITRHIKPNIRGKPVASLSTIQGVWYKLIAMLTFRHADLRANYGPYHVKRIEDVGSRRYGLDFLKLEGHSKVVNGVAFSHSGQLLASASNDKTIRLWNPITGEQLFELEGHSDGVIGVAFSPDDQLLASASEDKTVRLWNPVTGKSLQELKVHGREVLGVAFSPDGTLLASASHDLTVILWTKENSISNP